MTTEKSKGVVVTGGAGFIGSNLIKGLNDRGMTDIVVVDVLGENDKWKNVRGLKYKAIMDPHQFGALASSNGLEDIDTVFHMGANTNTTDKDADDMIVNNYSFSKSLHMLCKETETRLIYASSAATYGNGAKGYNDKCHPGEYADCPLNIYGYSKQLFDEYVVDNASDDDATVGLKFFNVFGPNEEHKGDMTSVVTKLIGRLKISDTAVLFKSQSEEYKDGEFVRDFIYVNDVVKYLLKVYDNKKASGIYNLGTGTPRSWNDLAGAVFKALGKEVKIAYTEMPAEVASQYQYHTCADTEKLGKDFGLEFTSLEDAVKDYIDHA